SSTMCWTAGRRLCPARRGAPPWRSSRRPAARLRPGRRSSCRSADDRRPTTDHRRSPSLDPLVYLRPWSFVPRQDMQEGQMSSATVVIVGGGVIGLSTAYHLAHKGFGRIIVIEKGPVGDGSSSRAAGIITGLLWSETGVLARKLSLARFRELSDELDGYTFQ